MKRIVFVILAIFLVTAATAALAQSPQNTTAPGPTTQREPGQTSNNLPNPGNPQTNLDQGTTTDTTGVTPETEQGEGVDVDVDTGARAEGAVDVDVNPTTDADTDASGSNEDQGLTGGDTDMDDTLPDTGSNLPLLGLIGLLALAAAVSVRFLSR
jgi:LPXTG-motif cell wall-anchored protein